MFLDAFSFPIRRGGWVVILVGTVLSVLFGLLKAAPLLGLGFTVVSAGYFGAFYLSIIDTTMTGRDEVPDWPSFSNLWDDVLVPFFRLTGLVVISFSPLLALLFLLPGDTNALLALSLCGVALLLGCLYLPMATLGAQAFGGLRGALPHIVLPGLARAMPSYLLAFLALTAGVALCAAVEHFTTQIPYAGRLLTAAVALYSLMFQARLIGLIYRQKADQLGWE